MRLPAQLRAARAVAKKHGVRALSADALENPKTSKSTKLNVLTLPLHLAPADSAGGKTVCAYAGGCRDLCLDGAGNRAYAVGKERARINRTGFYWNDRESFLTVWFSEIVRHVATARVLGVRPAVRPNATSDNAYERMGLELSRELVAWARDVYGVRVRPGTHDSMMRAFPRVSFYDYTKIPARFRVPRLPTNYRLTYSYDPVNRAADMLEALDMGLNVAVPFMGREVPTRATIHGRTLRVIDGDAHDYRPADPKGVFVGLRFKRITAPAVVARIGAVRARTGEGFAVNMGDV